jgi:hypothetical protein
MIAILLKHWKIIALTGLLALLIILIGLVDHYKSKYEEEKSSKEAVIQLTAEKDLIISTYKNKEGNLVTRANALEVENKTIQTLVKEGQLKWLKELEGLKKNMKNLETAYNIQTRVVDSVRTKLEKIQLYYINNKGDTTYYQGMSFKYHDEFTKIDAIQVTLDSIKVNYSVAVPITGDVYWSRKWFLGKKTYKAEVVSSNPHVQIDKIISLKLKHN